MTKWALEAVAQSCAVKKVFLEVPQNSKENTCARVSFLIKLQALLFSYEFCKTVFHNSFVTEQFRVTASEPNPFVPESQI